MKFEIPKRSWKTSIIAGICFCTTPFVVFLRFQNYPLTHTESLLAIAIVAGCGVASGLLMEIAGQYTRALVFALLITVTVDIQVQEPDRTWLLISVAAASLVLMFLARNYLASAGTVILAVMLVSSLVAPTGRADSRYEFAENLPPGDPSLPVFLHIILDEQIGVEGVPPEFDEDGSHAEALRDFYLDRGFQVFGRAYTRYDKTFATLSRGFNFTSVGYARQDFLLHEPRIYHMKENAYFDVMRSRGYQINVYQTGYFRFCGDKTAEDVATCFTYGTEAITSIENSPLPTATKMHVIFGVYSRLAETWSLHLPEIMLSPISAIGILDELQNDLLRAKPGSMYFAHLTLPHYPYSYETDCTLRDPSTWLTVFKPGYGTEKPPKTRNSPESRAQRYPLYLEQVACTHKKLGELFSALDDAGRFQNMNVLIHGDHGSRINVCTPDSSMSGLDIPRADMIDAFSTLFAFKQPGIGPSYDRRMLPLELLLESVARHGEVPDSTVRAVNHHVYIREASAGNETQPMPNFGRTLGKYETGLE